MDEFDLADILTEKDLQLFRTDAVDNLADLEEALLVLGSTPQDLDVIGRVFRVMHTIKGTAGMYGFEAAAHFTHDIENYYDQLRNGDQTLTKEVVNLTLDATDQLKIMLLKQGGTVVQEEVQRITSAFKKLTSQEKAVGKDDHQTLSVSGSKTETSIFRIRFRFDPHEPVLANATNPLIYLHALRSLGECTITCCLEDVPLLEALEEGICYVYWDILLKTQETEEKIRGEFIFVESELVELTIRKVTIDPESGPQKIGEILVEQGDVSLEAVEQAMQDRPLLGEKLIASGVVSKEKVKAAINEQKAAIELLAASKKGETVANVRVASDKLDDLVDQVGELVIAQARLLQLVQAHPGDLDLSAVAEEIAFLTEKLRDSAMSMRMLPIGTIFSRFNRLVHDLSRSLDKRVNLVTEGGETELDKTVIEHLNDPLVHIIRNSIDHGIEKPDVRQAMGKPSHGTVRLAAVHSGSKVHIQISDDGKGLDPEAIREKAVSKGLINRGAQLSEQELFGLIFAPGFSTTEKVTNISGRGVGMDVVKKAVESLRGDVEVQSQRGKGTTITIILPLTLAIIDGFLVQTAGRLFVMPLSLVKECVQLTKADEEKANGRQIINLRNVIVPYIRLRDRFGFSGERPAKEQIVITESDGKQLGMAVDRVLGQSQVVIKSLGDFLQDVAEFSGATILGNGRVVPILNVAYITATSRCDTHATSGAGHSRTLTVGEPT